VCYTGAAKRVMSIFSGFLILLILTFVALRLWRHSGYAVYFHWTDTPISAKQWVGMTHEQKTNYIFSTLTLAFKYYRQDPAVWLMDSQFELDRTVEWLVLTTDQSAKTRLNDGTFGRLVRIATFDTIKKVLQGVRSGKTAGPTLTGNEWLTWPLERKRAVLAQYFTIACMGLGIEKKWRDEDVSLSYVEQIDAVAEKRRDDPRLNKFIANFLNEFLRLVIEDFKRQQVAK
jgi:hypothetical protein